MYPKLLFQNKKNAENAVKSTFPTPFISHRGDKIWTCDLYIPNVALYQAEPRLADDFYILQHEKTNVNTFFDFKISTVHKLLPSPFRWKIHPRMRASDYFQINSKSKTAINTAANENNIWSITSIFSFFINRKYNPY